MDNGNSTVARTPAPDCVCCELKLRHKAVDRALFHPYVRHGYTKESGWTHPDLAEQRNGR